MTPLCAEAAGLAWRFPKQSLPVTAEKSVVKKPPVTAPPMEVVRGASVLLVEDEHALATAVSEALRDSGLQVDHAGDGHDALA